MQTTHATAAAAPSHLPIIMDRAELVRRAGKVGMKLSELTDRAGLSRTTLTRMGDNPKLTTLRKLTEALADVERERLAELTRLYGQQAA